MHRSLPTNSYYNIRWWWENVVGGLIENDFTCVNVRYPLPKGRCSKTRAVVKRIYEPLNWKLIVAAAGVDYRSGTPTLIRWLRLLWTFFFGFWLWRFGYTHILTIISTEWAGASVTRFNAFFKYKPVLDMTVNCRLICPRHDGKLPTAINVLCGGNIW